MFEGAAKPEMVAVVIRLGQEMREHAYQLGLKETLFRSIASALSQHDATIVIKELEAVARNRSNSDKARNASG